MVWVRLEDRFAEHPKVASLSDSAFRAHVLGLCYCGRNETEGFIPSSQLPPKAPELVAAKLWEPCEGGCRIHDFLDYNPTKAEIEETRKARSEAGKHGADVRWGKAKAKAKGMAGAMAGAMAKSCPVPVPVPGSVPDPSEPLGDSEVAAQRIAKFTGAWNNVLRDGNGYHVRKVARPPAPASPRGRLLLAWLGYAADVCPEGVPLGRLVGHAVQRAFALPFHAERREKGEEPLGLDWFIRPNHREEYVELGLLALSNGSHA